MNLLLGAPITCVIKEKLKTKIKNHLESSGVVPTLAIIQIGDNPRSNVYISQKEKFANAIGASVRICKFKDCTETKDLIKNMVQLSNDSSVHGIILQLPIPSYFSKKELDDLLLLINPLKDADGLTSINGGKLLLDFDNAILPATTRGISNLLKYYEIDPQGMHVVIIGRSNLVGKPTALYFLSRGATVTICHSGTKNLASIVKSGDIVISATGRPCLVTADMIQPQQVLIDIGINVSELGVISGDFDFDSISKILDFKGAITPVPGGVGPLTVAGLFENLLDLYEASIT